MQRDDEMILLSYVPDHLQEIQSRLENWARWSQDRWRRGHCVSAEHRFKSPDVFEQPDPRIEFNRLDGEALHSHVCDLPKMQRSILHLWFVHRARPGYIRRKLAIRRDGLPLELRRSMTMLRNAVNRR